MQIERESIMAKAFSLASWNVEHFKNAPNRVNRVVKFLQDQNPDILALYEVEGGEVFQAITAAFPNYSFQITEGPQAQEILAGHSSSISIFYTQKLQFKSGTTHMRPGLLATAKVDGEFYNILFLHLASSEEPRGFGLRDDMAIRAIKFRKTLDNAVQSLTGDANKRANYLFLGDLNSMGLNYPYDKDIDAKTELKRWDYRATRYYDMRRLSKSHPFTWSNGSDSSIPDSNLDHVYAAEHLDFAQFPAQGGTTADVDVRGWVNQPNQAAKDQWIEDFSDHSLLFLEVQKVNS
jgi:endonuclease/exonuclease/phosphatase family metal-dependent hydrolase